MPNIDEYLKQRSKSYNDAEVAPAKESSFEALPDGNYRVEVKEAVIKQTQDKENYYVNLKLRVEGPSHVGRFIFKACSLQEDRLKYLKTDLSVMGVDLTNIEKLEDALEVIPGRLLEIALKTKGEYQNVWINKLIVDGDITDSPSAKEDLPF